MDTLYINARIVDASTAPAAIIGQGYLLVHDDIIGAVGPGVPPDFDRLKYDDVVDCGGDMLMPGVIDAHVHFREPGLTQKADIGSESRAAVAGGVTSFCEMPNTRPATVTLGAWEEKMAIAASKSVANYAFFIGATTDNVDVLAAVDYRRCPGVKVFLGSSTGNMLMDDDGVLRDIDRRIPEGVPVAFHAEDNDIINRNYGLVCNALRNGDDSFVPIAMHPVIRSREACVASARRVADFAASTGRPCVLCHVSTADEALTEMPHNLFRETAPQYLCFALPDYERLGARIKCNPAIKTADDRNVLVNAVRMGRIDLIATDHAPHLPEDKDGDVTQAASGMPGVQFSLPLMLTLFDDPLSVSRLMCEGPARVYGIERRGAIRPGFYADIVRVRRARWTITDDSVLSRCGWTPYAGIECTWQIVATMVNGLTAYSSDAGVTGHRAPMPLTFRH